MTDELKGASPLTPPPVPGAPPTPTHRGRMALWLAVCGLVLLAFVSWLPEELREKASNSQRRDFFFRFLWSLALLASGAVSWIGGMVLSTLATLFGVANLKRPTLEGVTAIALGLWGLSLGIGVIFVVRGF